MNVIQAMFVAAAITVVVTPTFADYEPHQLFDLIGTSHLIATGEIVALRDKTYLFKTDEVLVGRRQDQVEIVRFQDWACARRWGPYEVGQKLLVFVNEQEGRWLIRGAGCEGESPMVDGHVYAQFTEALAPRENYGRRKVSAIPYKELRAAIKDYRGFFEVRAAKDPWRHVGKYSEFVPVESIRQVAREFVIRDYAQTSPIHRLLVDSTRREELRLEKLAKRGRQDR